MSNNKGNANLHNVIKGLNIFCGNVPPAPIEVVKNEAGKIVSKRKVDHVRGPVNHQMSYHPTKGWRKVRAYNPHILLDNLLVKFGLQSMYKN